MRLPIVLVASVLAVALIGCDTATDVSVESDDMDQGQPEGLVIGDGEPDDDVAPFAASVASAAADAPPVCSMIAESDALLRAEAATAALFSERAEAARRLLRDAGAELRTCRRQRGPRR